MTEWNELKVGRLYTRDMRESVPPEWPLILMIAELRPSTSSTHAGRGWAVTCPPMVFSDGNPLFMEVGWIPYKEVK